MSFDEIFDLTAGVYFRFYNMIPVRMARSDAIFYDATCMIFDLIPVLYFLHPVV